MSTFRYARSSRVREMAIADEVTLFHPVTQQALVLNQTASEIWRLLDGYRSAHDIVQALRDRYDTDPVKLTEDVADALEQFVRYEAVEVLP